MSSLKRRPRQNLKSHLRKTERLPRNLVSSIWLYDGFARALTCCALSWFIRKIRWGFRPDVSNCLLFNIILKRDGVCASFEDLGSNPEKAKKPHNRPRSAEEFAKKYLLGFYDLVDQDEVGSDYKKWRNTMKLLSITAIIVLFSHQTLLNAFIQLWNNYNNYIKIMQDYLRYCIKL